MNISNFENQINNAQQQLAKMQENLDQPPSSEREAEAITALSISIEELHVALEELEQQNSELIITRQELEKERQQYQNLFELAPDGYIVTDRNGVIQAANRSTEKLLHVRRDHLLGKPFILFICKTSRHTFHHCLDSLFQSYEIEELELELQPRHGKPLIAGISLSVELDFKGNITRLLWSIRDLSERIANEQKNRQQAALLDVATEAIIVSDLEDKITFWNSSAKNIYEWEAPEVLGKNAMELWWQETVPQLAEAKQSALAQGKWQGELKKYTKTGREILVESHWSVIRDRSEQPKSILIVDTDITEKKQLESQLFQSQRLESIGTLASGIAHDLNNILNPILGSVQILPRLIPQPNESCRKLTELIETNAKRGANIVKQVLAFSRSEEGERQNLKLNSVIEEVEHLIQETFPKTINLVVNTPPDLWTVYANPTQMHQVLLNLCVNSRDAMPYGGTLMICAENRIVTEDYARKHLDAEAGAYVVFSIIDTGYGIPPQILERIFEPFFTTKEVYQGTGLGLFTAMGIVKNHGGFIEVSSELKSGTQFEIFLPAIEIEKIETKVSTSALPEGKGELILVVDDEKDNLYMTQILLETSGYRVLTAKDGLDAVAIFEQHYGEIELVLMDMMMPNLDGATAIAELVKIAPQVKIISLSGLATDYSLARNSKVKAFLAKPITAESLLTTIKQVIQN
ncbi:signal transduction histidine kinase, nitrogen specific, NtrB [Stanieria cyanosphaera PCC 7437]|uniref:histidine kinase n=1 Tax=Stanieria cyanosphaera (strain ATCC 29371 / PCC 7437) TaxID=111780 RepID=K9XQ02_STAC7|nr:PAS domain-containing sensor histidine kinase [Stanieria cyanosphaera]AFZ33757.1 signal transduction histidine kinase, nitrogen specific, NtrB [Stanieria cyanosphaera PCC 7437]